MQSDLRAATWTGLFVLIGCVALIGVTIVLGQKSQIFESQYTLRTTFSNVQGLATGAPVRLSGVQVGTASSIRLPEDPTQRHVTVELVVNTRYRDRIRRDSRVMIRTMGALGDKYIEITSGTAEIVAADEILHGEDPIDFFDVADSAEQTLLAFSDTVHAINTVLTDLRQSGIINNVDATTQSIRSIVGAVDKGPGMMHSLIFDESLAATVDDVKYASQALRRTADAALNKEGAFGLLLEGTDLKETVELARQTMGHINGMTAEVANGGGLLHRLIYGSQEAGLLDDLRLSAQHGKRIMTRIDEGEGSLGLLINDPAVWARLKLLLGGLERSTTFRYLVERSIEAGIKAEAEAAKRDAEKGANAPNITAPSVSSMPPEAPAPGK